MQLSFFMDQTVTIIITVAIGSLIGISISSIYKAKRSQASNNQILQTTPRSVYRSSLILFSFALVLFCGMLGVNLYLNHTLFNRWSLGFISGTVVDCLLFTAVYLFAGSRAK